MWPCKWSNGGSRWHRSALAWRRRHGVAAAIIVLCLWSSAPALAQTSYPDRPIKIVNPFSAGSPVDFVGRLIARKLEAAWGQPVLVEVRSGAGGTLGANSVAKAAPDGYTLLVTSPSTLTSAPVLVKGLPYDPIKDFAPVWAVHSGGLVVTVNPALPVRTLGEFVRYARERPGQLAFASTGHGTTQHLAAELFMARTGVKLVHIPYRGGPAANSDLVAGHVQVMFDSLSNTYPAIQAGKLRGLALLRPKRSALLPEVPTAVESGVTGVDMVGFLGLFAPAATPPEILQKLTGTLGPAMSDPETIERLIAGGNENEFMLGDVLAKRVADEMKLFIEIAEKAGIQPQ
jgi:tripartite-type tricarboxylate transporter receptor subunit TctC